MKLINCYIDNFGKLSSREYNFTEGINGIIAENGYGKSTLAAFIKAMLFGLADTKAQKLDENERRKYEPWQGGAWGGSLTFSAGSRFYRVERSFSKKASEDECHVFDAKTNKELPPFKDEIGRELFGIDREGFERTVFLSEKQLSEKNDNATVAAKLSDLSGASYDMSELGAALALLDEQRRFYHKQGGSGELGDIARRQGDVELQLGELARLAKKHEEDGARLEELSRECEELRKRSENERRAGEERRRRTVIAEQYREMEQRRQEASRQKEELKGAFGAIPPTHAELDSVAAAENERLTLSSRLSKTSNYSSTLHAELSEEEVNNAERLFHEISEISEREKTLEEYSDKTAESYSKFIRYLILIADLLTAVLAIVLVLFNQLVPCLITVLTIQVLCVFAVVMIRKRRTKSLSNTVIQLVLLNTKKEKLKQEVDAFIQRSGFKGMKPHDALREIRKQFIESELKRSAAEKEKAALAAEEKRLAELDARLKEFYSRYKNAPISYLRSKLSALEAAEELCKRLGAESDAFKTKYDITDEDITESAPTERQSPSAELDEKERERARLKSIYELDGARLEETDELEAELERLKEREKSGKERLEIIKKTKAYLEEAKDAMNARYLGKTLSSFKRYLEIIADDRGDYGMDTSFTVTRHEGGRSRARDCYSKGTRELYSFALRLALTDSLYEGEKPFIVLDDPFAYFDDVKLEKATRLIKKLSSDRQFIYFSASEARSIR